MTADIVRAELIEVREELRRADAKARDLLVVTGLAVTVSAAVSGLLRTTPPVPVTTLLCVAIWPWLVAVVQLLLVVRPLHAPYSLGAFADPDRAQAVRDLSVEQWRQQRWKALADIATVKYRRLRRAVDLLLWMLLLLISSGMLWLLLAITA